jgi:hypothetical protein
MVLVLLSRFLLICNRHSLVAMEAEREKNNQKLKSLKIELFTL